MNGEVNQEGLDYYHRVVDMLNENGIEPFCTLYHWDLPQVLQDAGGWGNRRTIQAFVQYAETMFREFHGKINHWLTFNEPWCIAFLSNMLGVHAPGLINLQTAINVGHNLLVAHGLSVRRFRELSTSGQIGIAPNVSWALPYSTSEEDKAACARTVSLHSDWFLQPIYQGSYPQFLVDWFAQQGATVPIQEGDMDIISEPIDLIGINYYSMSVNRFNPEAGFLQSEEINMGLPVTDIGWPVESRGLYEVLHYLQKYGNIDIYITENGACINDEVVNGKVQDDRRISYMQQHLVQVHRAIHDGLHVKGYMAWSLMDNFEWAEGYNMRFGMIHVDFRTLPVPPRKATTGIEMW